MGPFNEKQIFLTPERGDPPKPWKKTPSLFFWQSSHPGHIQYQCLHMLTPATPAPPCYLNFSGGQSISERLTKRPGLLASFSFIQRISMTSAESRSVHSQMLSDALCRRTAGVSQWTTTKKRNNNDQYWCNNWKVGLRRLQVGLILSRLEETLSAMC